jgi:hypothetical protein
MLKCHAIGETVDAFMYISYKLTVDRTIVLSDSFVVTRNTITCTMHGVAWSDIGCIKQLANLGQSRNLKLPRGSSSEYYRALMNLKLDNVILYVMINGTHVWLDSSPRSYVACKIEDRSSADEVSQFEIARKKHYSKLGGSISHWVGLISQRVYRISDTLMLVAEQVKQDKKLKSLSICKEIASVEGKLCMRESLIDRSSVKEFMKEHGELIATTDTEIKRLEKIVRNDCESDRGDIADNLLDILVDLRDSLAEDWDIEEILKVVFFHQIYSI